MEIATRLKTVDNRLRPFIVQVSSEPDWFKDTQTCELAGDSANGPIIPDEADFRPIGIVTDLLTVNSTRIARGYETIVQLRKQAAAINGGDIPSVAQINICPQQKESFLLEEIYKFINEEQSVRQRNRAMRIMRKTRQQPHFKSVSLSWWLSPPLQAFLDGQIYSKRNAAQRDCVISLLKDTQPGTQACQ